jgi:VIT1/CCC1 family predicted Fe2+/Mn2+ transporter
MGHTLPFLIPQLKVALTLAYVVVVLELLVISFIRFRYLRSPLGRTIVQVIGGGAIVFAVGLWLGRLGAGA